jgi:cation:H+ antiporter
VLLFGFDGTISLLNGLLRVAGTIGYAVLLIRNSRKQTTTDHAVKTPAGPVSSVSSGPPLRQWLQNGGLILGGIVLVVLGSSWLVSGAKGLARILCLSELVIGVRTGLPEVATSVIAS